MDDLILHAARTAKTAHAGQLRKYHKLPYILHPARVAGRISLVENVTPEEVAAAWLHDVIEDCGYTQQRLLDEGFPETTARLVVELSNPSKQQPELPRWRRTELDRRHIAAISDQAKRIKLADRTDNLRDMALAKDGYKSLYVAESILLSAHLRKVDDELLSEFHHAIELLGFDLNHTDERVPQNQ